MDCLSRGVEVAVVDDKARKTEGAKSLEAIVALRFVLRYGRVVWRVVYRAEGRGQ